MDWECNSGGGVYHPACAKHYPELRPLPRQHHPHHTFSVVLLYCGARVEPMWASCVLPQSVSSREHQVCCVCGSLLLLPAEEKSDPGRCSLLWINILQVVYFEEMTSRQNQKRGGREREKERKLFYWENFAKAGCRENKLDTSEDRMSQEMRMRQKIITDC